VATAPKIQVAEKTSFFNFQLATNLADINLIL